MSDETKPPAPISADQMTAPLVESMPLPTGEGSAPVQPAPAPVVDPAQIIRDDSGQQFDPTIHLVDDTGKPRIAKNGLFMRKRGPKAGATSSGEQQTFLPPPPNAQPSEPVAAQKPAPDQYEVAAEMMLQTGYGVAASFFTNDIRPEFDPKTGALTADGQMEHASLHIPLSMVLREKGSTGMTPTQMFCLALAALVAKKAAKPTVKEKFMLLLIKVKSWFNKNQPVKTQ